MINKLLIKKRFEKSLETYDENAVVQKAMALRLIELLNKNAFENIFEFGTGSGLLTKEIAEKLTFEKLFLNDIVKKSEEYAKKYTADFEFISGDVEKIDFPKEIDLIISNASIQWLKDFDKFLVKISNSLNNDGIFAFTTFGIENFEEIQHIFGICLEYMPISHLKEKIKEHFEILHLEEIKAELEFKTPKDILKHMQSTGVNCLSVKNFCKSSFLGFDREYKKLFSTQNGVKLTYHPIYVVAKKK